MHDNCLTKHCTSGVHCAYCYRMRKTWWSDDMSSGCPCGVSEPKGLQRDGMTIKDMLKALQEAGTSESLTIAGFIAQQQELMVRPEITPCRRAHHKQKIAAYFLEWKKLDNAQRQKAG